MTTLIPKATLDTNVVVELWDDRKKAAITRTLVNLVLSQPRNRKGLEAKGRTDGLGPSLRKSVWVIVIWRLTEY